MKRGKIEIKNNRVLIYPEGGVFWLTRYQIADLFGVFISTVGRNIQSILKSGSLKHGNVVLHKKTTEGKVIELYSLEMIIALAFRIRSEKAEVFRAWVVRRTVNNFEVCALPRIDTILN
ncbi:MAG: hypothetical protein A2W90_18370 [Bacteroidetes bacterium GWF2_42_66]|nr:MAG: hypothetical protein A2W92_11545 [Bacteroidetes bacterium GWA2_42_15]OFX98218.1 MAG: hypothetical protein A2W89_09870 [Bacteroidetes bacterium GWE2_42_39]OFY42601.1 MAG: hypothetical protein A2W90_18370 [Bacteroidetes bacterium GWF2_42_66]HAZ03028.1 protein-tyrosine kinase [Marinilabiliales bacterium]HBL74321.1 protein-tyrosine kinase [Prolixibacteraceae bacterium]